MGRALSSWERLARQQARLAEMQAAADFRARERERARLEREAERRRVQLERERDQRRRQESKERERERAQQAKAAEIEALRREVAEFDAYIAGLTTLHEFEVSLGSALARYRGRCRPRPLPAIEFVPEAFTEALVKRVFTPPEFEETPFSSTPLGNSERILAVGMGALGCALQVGVWIGPASAGRAAFSLLFSLASALLVYHVVRQNQRTHDAAVERWSEEHRARCERERQEFDRAEVARREEYAKRSEIYRRSELERRDFFELRNGLNQKLHAAWDERRMEVLQGALEGSRDCVATICEALLPLSFALEPPGDLVSTAVSEHEIGYAVPDASSVYLLLHLPSEGLVPEKWLELAPSGTKQKVKAASAKQRHGLYDAFVASFSLAHAMRIFEACPFLEHVTLDAGIVTIDAATGLEHTQILLHVRYTMAGLSALKVDRVDAEEMLTGFEHKRRSIGSTAKAKIEPWMDASLVTWATPDDEAVDVPHGLLAGRRFPTLENEFERRAPILYQATWWDDPIVVSSSGGGNCVSLGEAVARVRPGGTIRVQPGVYPETIVLDTPLSIEGTGALGDVVLAPREGVAILCRSVSATLRNLVIRTDSDRGKAAVECSSGGTILDKCTIEGPFGIGLAIVSAAADCRVQASRIEGCGHGAMVDDRARLILSDSIVRGSQRDGIVAAERASVRLNRTTVEGNGGVGVRVQGKSSVTLADATLAANREGDHEVEPGSSLSWEKA